MEVQGQRQREEDSRRDQEFQTMELAENGPADPIEEGGRNVLTLTGTEGSSTINVSLTSSLQSDKQPRTRMPQQGDTMSLPHQPWEERGTDTPNSAMRRSDNSTPLIQLQKERVRNHQELHHLDQ